MTEDLENYEDDISDLEAQLEEDKKDNDTYADRNSDGTFKKGNKSNTSGRSKYAGKHRVMRLARARSLRAVEVMCQIMEDEDSPAKDRITAAQQVYNIAWGKPGIRKDEQSVSIDDIKQIMPQVVIASPQSIPSNGDKDKN